MIVCAFVCPKEITLTFQLKLFLLGSPRLERRGESVELNLRQAMALLVYLVFTKGKLSQDELATLLWPECDQSSARSSLLL